MSADGLTSSRMCQILKAILSNIFFSKANSMIILITLLWIFISFLTLISYFPAVPHYSSCGEGGCSQTSVSFPVPQLGYGLYSFGPKFSAVTNARDHNANAHPVHFWMPSNCFMSLNIISHGSGLPCCCLLYPSGCFIRGETSPGIFGCQSQPFLSSSSRAGCIKHTLSVQQIWHLKDTYGPSHLCCVFVKCSAAGMFPTLELCKLTTQHVRCRAGIPYTCFASSVSKAHEHARNQLHVLGQPSFEQNSWMIFRNNAFKVHRPSFSNVLWH